MATRKTEHSSYVAGLGNHGIDDRATWSILKQKFVFHANLGQIQKLILIVST